MTPHSVIRLVPLFRKSARAVGLALAVSLLATSCSTPARVPETGARVEILLQAPTHLGGVAVGDVLPHRPGLEIVAVGDRSVWLLWRRALDESFVGREVLKTDGEMIQVAVGEVRADHPGDEVVVGGVAMGGEDDGGDGIFILCTGVPGQDALESEHAVATPALVHALAIHGRAVWAAGFDGHLHRLVHGASGYRSSRVAELPAVAKSMAPYRDGVVVALTDGTVRAFVGPEDAEGSLLARGPAPRARIAARGAEVLCADDAGRLELIRPESPPRLLLEAGDKLRGAVLFGGMEEGGGRAATCGYDGAVRWVPLPGAAADAADGEDPVGGERVPFRDLAKGHHLAAGDLDGSGATSVVLVNYAGRVVRIDLPE